MGPRPQLAQLGYESAALDLALRRRERDRHAPGRAPRPSFVNSFGLGDPPPSDHARAPGSLPATALQARRRADVVARLLEEVASTGAVDTIDFKGQYGLEVKQPDALVPLYEHVVELSPDAVLEDPHDEPGIAELLAPHADRVSYDAPIRSVADLAAVAIPPKTINVKPSRVGGTPARALRPLRRQRHPHVRRRDGRAGRGARADRAAGVAVPPRHAQRRRPPAYNAEHRPTGCRRARSTRWRRRPASGASSPEGVSALRG